jgi:alkanesulfonate monooxygenase SsuD/methylene tetrahydromethanopterin reductase-like flavin-dependent oxidoreductase (luciferase family)
MFIADTLGPYDVYKGPANVAPSLASGAQFPLNDPSYLVPAMAAVTKNLIFGLTASTSYEQPYSLVRRFTTVDHLAKGRVAWNIVTSYLDSAARNHGLKEQIPHDERYNIADEYLEVLYKLWEGSWRNGAVVADRKRGVYIEEDGCAKFYTKGSILTPPDRTSVSRLRSALPCSSKLEHQRRVLSSGQSMARQFFSVANSPKM